jgi:hypothetical protein
MNSSNFSRTVWRLQPRLLNNSSGKHSHALFASGLYGPGYPRGEPITTKEALAVLWLGPDRFFRIIDLAVSCASSRHTEIFARVSGHAGRF